MSRSRSELLLERNVPEAEAEPVAAEVESESGSERPLSRLGGLQTHTSDTDRPGGPFWLCCCDSAIAAMPVARERLRLS